MHDRLLEALLSVASVRLVAAIKDERLGFPDGKDLRVFIPDLHLISDQRFRDGGYSYRTNFPDLLTQVVLKLAGLKSNAAADEKVIIYQMGDFLDLWREAPRVDSQLDVASRIRDDHEDLMAALLAPELKTAFLLGNHDFDLYRAPEYRAWERRYYIPDVEQGPSAILLHGDVFDWVEKLPVGIREILVFMFAPGVQPTDYKLGMMGSIRNKVIQSHGDNAYTDFIQNQTPAAVGKTQDVAAGIPASFNVQKAGVSSKEALMFLDQAHDCCARANRDYGFKLKVAVIGHTHHARIAVRENGDGDLFTLIDCGAWLENCIGDGDGTPTPNAQIAALSGNEARIYQLSPAS
jgi:UDP-2,3-diacylglucosamine pyrophosphatase LpxH